MFDAITENYSKMLKLVDHLPNERHGIECSECITFGDNMVDTFDNLVTSIFKFTTLAVVCDTHKLIVHFIVTNCYFRMSLHQCRL